MCHEILYDGTLSNPTIGPGARLSDYLHSSYYFQYLIGIIITKIKSYNYEGDKKI